MEQWWSSTNLDMILDWLPGPEQALSALLCRRFREFMTNRAVPDRFCASPLLLALTRPRLGDVVPKLRLRAACAWGDERDDALLLLLQYLDHCPQRQQALVELSINPRCAPRLGGGQYRLPQGCTRLRHLTLCDRHQWTQLLRFSDFLTKDQLAHLTSLTLEHHACWWLGGSALTGLLSLDLVLPVSMCRLKSSVLHTFVACRELRKLSISFVMGEEPWRYPEFGDVLNDSPLLQHTRALRSLVLQATAIPTFTLGLPERLSSTLTELEVRGTSRTRNADMTLLQAFTSLTSVSVTRATNVSLVGSATSLRRLHLHQCATKRAGSWLPRTSSLEELTWHDVTPAVLTTPTHSDADLPHTTSVVSALVLYRHTRLRRLKIDARELCGLLVPLSLANLEELTILVSRHDTADEFALSAQQFATCPGLLSLRVEGAHDNKYAIPVKFCFRATTKACDFVSTFPCVRRVCVVGLHWVAGKAQGRPQAWSSVRVVEHDAPTPFRFPIGLVFPNATHVTYGAALTALHPDALATLPRTLQSLVVLAREVKGGASHDARRRRSKHHRVTRRQSHKLRELHEAPAHFPDLRSIKSPTLTRYWWAWFLTRTRECEFDDE